MTAFVPLFAGSGASCVRTLRSSSLTPSFAVVTSNKNRVRIITPIARRRSVTVAQYNYNIYQDNEDRSRRVVGDDERAVSIPKPLGLVLEEGQDGMVFVASVDPNGNSAKMGGDVNEGDIVVAVSATFGDEVWSTRGVGLERVMKSIRVRSGDLVTLVLETPAELSQRKDFSTREAEARRASARESRGEREVINPVTWGSNKSSSKSTNNALYEYGDPAQAELNEKLKNKLKNEIAAPYQQNWILWISGGVFLLVILSVIVGLK